MVRLAVPDAVTGSADDTGRRFVFGPVVSRRLGRSLGVDLIPYKVCSYDCVYCQLGRTTRLTAERSQYVRLDRVIEDVRRALEAPGRIDYVTLSGSGEPTLCLGLGDLIGALRERTQVPIAVLTNGSLLSRPELRQELAAADLVIPSLDAGDPATFARVNRPDPSIGFESMVEGLMEFGKGYRGRVWLEVFIVRGYNDRPDQVERIAALARQIAPERLQLNTVARPPAEGDALPVHPDVLHDLAGVFGPSAEIVSERPAEATAAGGGAEVEGLLNLLARRPCDLVGMAEALGAHPNAVLKILPGLVREGKVTVTRHGGRDYYAATRRPDQALHGSADGGGPAGQE